MTGNDDQTIIAWMATRDKPKVPAGRGLGGILVFGTQPELESLREQERARHHPGGEQGVG
jgi:hypothetical protein